MKIYVGVMDNGSDDAIIHMISTDFNKVLKHLQKKFLEWRDDEEDLEGIIDKSAPTLEEMDRVIVGHGVMIVEVEDGAELNEELRTFDFENCKIYPEKETE